MGFRPGNQRLRSLAIVMLTGLTAGLTLAQSGAPNTTSHDAVLRRGPSGIVLRVKDPTGALIPNAQIRLLSGQGQLIHTGVTNNRGRLQITRFQPGDYVVQVSVHGFQTCRKAIRIKRGTLDNIQVKLEVAAVSQTAEIMARFPIEVEVVNLPAERLPMIPYYSYPLNLDRLVLLPA